VCVLCVCTYTHIRTCVNRFRRLLQAADAEVYVRRCVCICLHKRGGMASSLYVHVSTRRQEEDHLQVFPRAMCIYIYICMLMYINICMWAVYIYMCVYTGWQRENHHQVYPRATGSCFGASLDYGPGLSVCMCVCECVRVC